MRIHTLLSLVTLALVSSFAQAEGAETPANYQCQLIVIAKDMLNGSEVFKYEAPAKSGSHGGQDYTFSKGHHKVTAITDARWMGINWEREGKSIVQVISVRADDNVNSQVLLAYNPQNTDEQVSLDCAPKAAKP